MSLFPAVCRAAGLPEPIAEFRFAPPRKWRFDWAWPLRKCAIEVEGGAFSGGRHTRGAGFLKDMEKYNAAVLGGWKVLRVTPATLLSEGPALVKRAIGIP